MGGIDDYTEETVDTTDDRKVINLDEERPKRKAFHYWKVGDREYKLKLTTAMIEKVENKYRTTNLMNLIASDGLPALSVMLTILQAAMSPWEHKLSYAKVQSIYDTYVENGGNQMELLTQVIMPTLSVSGFFTDRMVESMQKDLETAEDLI